jgi:uncharacterized membrane protein YagU involved in acid resistance
MISPITATPTTSRVMKAIVYATLVAGTLDLLDASVFFGLHGIPLAAIYQSIAAGLLGPASFKGGMGTATLGVVLHYAIMAVMVIVYVLAARRIALLAERPFVCGAIYGLLLYIVMNAVVLPLSAMPPKAFPHGIVLANGLFAHIVLVGLSIGWFARWCRRRSA